MKIPPVKGTRDFYPPIMAIRNHIVDGWKQASLRNGFEEYDGPIFEHLKMYQVKSGDEIVEQLFHFQDRGGRDLAIRPEITPTLARMVNQQINTLPRPIKWFSSPRLCRAERPQRGRLREFFQWNIDIIGVEDVVADAEIIFCALDYLQQAGLKVEDVVVRISSRRMLAEVLKSMGVADDQLDSLYAALDKKAKLPAEAFAELVAKVATDQDLCQQIIALMNCSTVDEIGKMTQLSEAAQAALDELNRLFEILEIMGIAEYCTFDIGIVRGLAYYTGPVFEIYDRASELRALGGGGRYDNLLQQFGGPQVTATGLGMGDCVLGILLEEKGLLEGKDRGPGLDVYVACADPDRFNDMIQITARLRKAGKSCGFSYKAIALKKQLKQAASQQAKTCIIVGQELADGQVAVKDMETGEQTLVAVDEII